MARHADAADEHAERVSGYLAATGVSILQRLFLRPGQWGRLSQIVYTHPLPAGVAVPEDKGVSFALFLFRGNSALVGLMWGDT